MLSKQLFIGVDGGATKCMVRVEDASGQLLGQATTGPANIRLSVTQAWQSILAALEQILTPQNISLTDSQYDFFCGMGLAGCEIATAYEDFIKSPHPFRRLEVVSDAHTACLGAHQGKEGAIIIIGTGVVGFQIANQHVKKVSGWGFPQDDLGGGAWLGLEAVKLTLQSLDGRQSSSPLTRAIFARFNEDLPAFVHWSNHANSTAFATLAPYVVTHAQQQDGLAISLLQMAAAEIEKVSRALQSEQRELPMALLGGLASFVEPYLSASLRQHLHPPIATPDVGAVILIRNACKDETK